MLETLTNRQAPFACNGATILFALTVPYFNEAEITVTLRHKTTNAETPLALNVDFEIPGEGDPDYGNIRLIGGYAEDPPSSDYELHIIRIMPLTQLMDLITGNAFNPILNEAAFDRLMMICQQLADALSRAAIAKTTSGLSGLVLPVEPLKYIRGNAAGNGLEAIAGEPPTNVWRYGSGVPAAGLGSNGDYYLRITTGDIYYKIAGSWGDPIACIMGPKGDPGTGDMSKATYDPNADGVIAAAQLDAGILYKATYGAHSILYAVDAETPLALSVGTNTTVGRGATGNIKALSVAEQQTMITSAAFPENTGILLPASLSADGKYFILDGIAGTLGETVAFGETVYFKAADSKWYKTKADATATAGAVDVGFCCVGGNANAATLIMFIGLIRADSLFDAFTLSAALYLSASVAGKITNTAPSGAANYVVRKVGRAHASKTVRVNVSEEYVILAS